MKKITKIDSFGDLSIIETTETKAPKDALADAVMGDYFDVLFQNKVTWVSIWNAIKQTRHGWYLWTSPTENVHYIISNLTK